MKLGKMKKKKNRFYIDPRKSLQIFKKKTLIFCHVEREKIFVKNVDSYLPLTYDWHWRFSNFRNILFISAASVNMIDFYSRPGESGFTKSIRRALRVFKYISRANSSSVQRYVNERY